MKHNPLLILKRPRFLALPKGKGCLTFDATGASVGMGLGMLLATVVPQFTLAQEPLSKSGQQVRQTRKGELRLKADDAVQKDSMVTLATVETSKPSPRLVEVETATPPLSAKRLSPEELRELRRQLLEQP